MKGRCHLELCASLDSFWELPVEFDLICLNCDKFISEAGQTLAMCSLFVYISAFYPSFSLQGIRYGEGIGFGRRWVFGLILAKIKEFNFGEASGNEKLFLLLLLVWWQCHSLLVTFLFTHWVLPAWSPHLISLSRLCEMWSRQICLLPCRAVVSQPVTKRLAVGLQVIYLLGSSPHLAMLRTYS